MEFMLIRHCVLAFVVTLAPALAWAETCKYEDAEGHVIYSNTPNNPPKDAKKVKCFADPAPQTGTAPAPGGQKADSASRKDFPKVDGKTQKRRDDERRRILEKELADEQLRLDAARQELAEQESVRTGDERNYQRFIERVQPFRDAVDTHQRNLDAIQREIANLK